jgi:hypothetical protein
VTDAQGHTEVVGLTLYDMILVKHLFDKLLRVGGVSGKELSFVAALREKVLAVSIAVGIDIEEIGNKPVTQGEVS